MAQPDHSEVRHAVGDFGQPGLVEQGS